MEVGGQRHAPAAFSPGKTPVPTVQESEWASEPVCSGRENLTLAGVRTPVRQRRSEWLYRLRYPGPHLKYITNVNS